MENTQIYIIERLSGGIGFYSTTPVGFCTTKEDAEYKVWQLNKSQEQGQKMIFLYSSDHYTYHTTVFMPIEKDKEYSKFLKEKIAEKETEIKNSQECKEKDEEKISSLTKELEKYNLYLGNAISVKK